VSNTKELVEGAKALAAMYTGLVEAGVPENRAVEIVVGIATGQQKKLPESLLASMFPGANPT
jgi:hypothetical protein